MMLIALLIRLRARGVGLYIDNDQLRVSLQPGILSSEEMQALAEHKEALKNLPRPYLNAAGELIVPSDAPPQYHWQYKTKTLRDVNASPEVWRRHTSAPYPDDLLREKD